MFIMPKQSRLLYRYAEISRHILYNDSDKRNEVLYSIAGFFYYLEAEAQNQNRSSKERDVLSPFYDGNNNLTLTNRNPKPGEFKKQYNSLIAGVTIDNISPNTLDKIITLYQKAKQYLFNTKEFKSKDFNFKQCKLNGSELQNSKNITCFELNNILINTGAIPDPNQSEHFTPNNYISQFKYKNQIYTIYIYNYNNNDDIITGVIAEGQGRTSNIKYSITVKSNTSITDFYSHLEDKIKNIYHCENDESIQSKITRTINEQFNFNGTNVNSIITSQTNWKSPDTSNENNDPDEHLLEKIEEIKVTIPYSYFDLIQDLIIICAKAKKEKCSLKSFKLIRETILASRLRPKVRLGYFNQNISSALIHIAIKNNELFTAFKQLFNEFGFIYNLKLISSYYNPKLAPAADLSLEECANTSNNCVGIIVKTSNNKFITIPFSAISNLRTLYAEYQRISNTIQSTHWLKALPQYASNILNSIKSVFSEAGANLLDKVKSLFSSSQEYDSLKNYDRDMINIVLSRRLSEKFGGDTRNVDEALLALIVKRTNGIKIYDNISQADDDIHSLTNSQYTFLHDMAYQSSIKYTANPTENSGPNKRAEKLLSLVMEVDIKALNTSDYFGVRFATWYKQTVDKFIKDHSLQIEEVIRNNNDVQKIINIIGA